jgi:hypothetical protein
MVCECYIKLDMLLQRVLQHADMSKRTVAQVELVVEVVVEVVELELFTTGYSGTVPPTAGCMPGAVSAVGDAPLELVTAVALLRAAVEGCCCCCCCSVLSTATGWSRVVAVAAAVVAVVLTEGSAGPVLPTCMIPLLAGFTAATGTSIAADCSARRPTVLLTTALTSLITSLAVRTLLAGTDTPGAAVAAVLVEVVVPVLAKAACSSAIAEGATTAAAALATASAAAPCCATAAACASATAASLACCSTSASAVGAAASVSAAVALLDEGSGSAACASVGGAAGATGAGVAAVVGDWHCGTAGSSRSGTLTLLGLALSIALTEGSSCCCGLSPPALCFAAAVVVALALASSLSGLRSMALLLGAVRKLAAGCTGATAATVTSSTLLRPPLTLAAALLVAVSLLTLLDTLSLGIDNAAAAVVPVVVVVVLLVVLGRDKAGEGGAVGAVPLSEPLLGWRRVLFEAAGVLSVLPLAVLPVATAMCSVAQASAIKCVRGCTTARYYGQMKALVRSVHREQLTQQVCNLASSDT